MGLGKGKKSLSDQPRCGNQCQGRCGRVRKAGDLSLAIEKVN